jgi:hypothetical protein
MVLNVVTMITSRRIKWAGQVKRTRGENYTIFVGEAEGSRPLGRPRSRWGNDIKNGK